MPKVKFYKILEKELRRLDTVGVAKRKEIVIDKFSSRFAVISGKKYLVFNSNDYLGLRLTQEIKRAEHKATQKYGTGPGAVRFISGTLKVHVDLEAALAKFHKRQASAVFSSAFAANLGVMTAIVKGPGQDTLVKSPVIVISDELNHRSIIDSIRLSGISSEQKAVYKHLDYENLAEVVKNNIGKFPRAVVITDGVFSMLGHYADLAKIRKIIDKYQTKYKEGILLVVDDSHGIAAFGKTGRGTQEVTGSQADIMTGTLGKGLGTDGGYVVADKVFIDYLKETAATYIYSNSISPGTSGAALSALQLIDSAKGKKLLSKSFTNVLLFKRLIIKAGFTLAADSIHPIQAILIGEPQETQMLAKSLYQNNILVTSLSYPVVPKGQDELRVQISAAHSSADIRKFVQVLAPYKRR